ncbi:hypothetical protein C8R46DRAFT_1031343 [Mycena filopes]|nr:hypothetical protein C8R46DRAFT_1031343 [Mycena filopes]
MQDEREEGVHRGIQNQTTGDLKLVATIPTEDCPQWFDKQFNDYITKGPSLSESVNIKWFGHPGDSEHDIRARKFIVRWSKYLENPENDLRVDAVKKGKVVLRWKYYCAGVHDRDIDEAAESEVSMKGSPAPSLSASASPEDVGRWNRCSGKCEVTADDLAHVKIWQTGEHGDAPDHFPFTFSRHLRLVILDWMRRYGAKATSINKALVSEFQRGDSQGNTEGLPPHRLPTLKQIRQMLPAVRHRARLDRNPFRATHIMVDRNPDTILIPDWSYTPHDFGKPDEESTFKVAITDDFSTDSTILNTAGPNGVLLMDSTHRLQNENRAATTVLCTANEDKHMAPGAYLISANIKAETIKEWLLATIAKIEARAREIVAVLKALGLEDDVFIRLCQFHVIQAILRWDSDGGKAGIGFKLSLDLKFEICVLFRTLQRCRTWESWPLAKQTFHEGLESLLGDVEETSPELDAGELSEADDKSVKAAPKKSVPQTKAAKAAGLSCFEAVKAYFDTNWFNERWIAHFTDIGMPSDQSRDGVWNTNNWSETAFKQFNTIFLDNKHNKRYEIVLPSRRECCS